VCRSQDNYYKYDYNCTYNGDNDHKFNDNDNADYYYYYSYLDHLTLVAVNYYNNHDHYDSSNSPAIITVITSVVVAQC